MIKKILIGKAIYYNGEAFSLLSEKLFLNLQAMNVIHTI